MSVWILDYVARSIWREPEMLAECVGMTAYLVMGLQCGPLSRSNGATHSFTRHAGYYPAPNWYLGKPRQ